MGCSATRQFFLPRLFACNFHRLLLLLLSTLPVPVPPLPPSLLLLRRKVQINLWRPTVTFLAPLSLCCHYSYTLSAAWDLLCDFLLLLLLLHLLPFWLYRISQKTPKCDLLSLSKIAFVKWICNSNNNNIKRFTIVLKDFEKWSEKKYKPNSQCPPEAPDLIFQLNTHP